MQLVRTAQPKHKINLLSLSTEAGGPDVGHLVCSINSMQFVRTAQFKHKHLLALYSHSPRRTGGPQAPASGALVYIENEEADKRRYSQTCLAKPNSQARTGARKFSPVQLTINRIGNLTQLICTLLYVMTTHTCIRILYCRVYPQLPPVIGAPWGLKKNLNAFVAGTLRGYFLPVRYGSVGVQLTRLRALYQGTLTSGCVWKNLNTSYLYNAAILASFFFIRVFKGVLSSEFVD